MCLRDRINEPESENLPKSPQKKFTNDLDQVTKEGEEKDLSESDNNEK